ncbi:prevent-host-death protein [Marivirga tractuosa]|uniref:TonB-dependent receptor plug n=1 Tax=Marivirga tractuosa (strain ATCC 23168 / DSM 4126 / NBRC 15989 / NCIMB 1408 / VKM B-1430 / H-43) TaxID=643867 RepID=E4TRH7_MARTH|nr:TonB-dependent receptor [Marivirga tractuosa]ADR20711.1 TonB-dependent receptor plug [Marivirga tractuosa DSM 4126]BDD14839.1 prevent-host-death protein [Marivirga tractuosa]
MKYVLKSFVILIFFFLSKNLAAQTAGTLKGVVMDEFTKVPVVGAHLHIKDAAADVGAISDVNGFFIFDNLPVGKGFIEVSSIGFKPTLVPYELTSGKDLFIEVAMEEAQLQMDEVVVKAGGNAGESPKETVLVSVQSIGIEEAQRTPGSFNDPARVAQSYAGVVSSDDEGNEISVRGNTPSGILWRLEGIEIMSPNHFPNGPGAAGGGVSMISNAVLNQSDFYAGAFSADIGNATSGVFDLYFRKGNSDDYEHSIQVGILGLQFSTEGPILKSSKASYLVNYRYSTVTLLHNAGFKIGGENSIAPEFQDLNFKLYFPTKNKGNVSVFGIIGASEAGDKAVSDTTLWEDRSDYLQEKERYITRIVGLKHEKSVNSNFYIANSIVVNQSNSNFLEDTVNTQLESFSVENLDVDKTELRHKIALNLKLNSKNRLTIGNIYSFNQSDINHTKYDDGVGDLNTLMSAQSKNQFLQSYVQIRHNWSSKLIQNAGVHLSNNFLQNEILIEPRLSFRYSLNARQYINLGIGLHSSLLDPYYQKQVNKSALQLSKALHIIGAYQYFFMEGWSLNAELYYQYLYDLAVDTSQPGIALLNNNLGYQPLNLASDGKGKNYGVDLDLNRNFTDGFYLKLTGSLFQSTYRGIDDQWRNTRFNANFINTFTFGKEFMLSNSKTIGTSFRWVYRGGFREIPIDLEASKIAGETVYNYQLAYASKTPDYFRMDASLYYQKNFSQSTMTISLDIQNLTNRLNFYREVYNREKQIIEEQTYLGLLPNINLKYDF